MDSVTSEPETKEKKDDKLDKMTLKHREITPLLEAYLVCLGGLKECKTNIQDVKIFGTCGSSLSVRTSEYVHLRSYWFYYNYLTSLQKISILVSQLKAAANRN